MKTTKDKILDVAGKQSVFRAGDIPGVRKPQTQLCRMVADGELIRVGRGLYSLPDAEVGENHSLVEAVKLCHRRDFWMMSRNGFPINYSPLPVV
ncbi:type IV toxin-antitoxin system AbiEi family antitoxin domain-containing protein [Chlorobium phaeovibrioides]|uniref:type IV toxin-antitoxin system AbiEi family antitoxin domain-containing protein n=1 Tax=Chlorobium phaeovibrioides TaxID=1094 RepID=UPI00123108BA|nr:type IV toxin-antitoxin system AbiEi family antitoxin domain-containing protein [Chlorobium phaeovibrioides]QEQ57191.1 type IV toxin-antitoxin system AbiEi family antitoxin domain-containing protein [Chlorobium phaeovibrioides]